MVQNEDMIISWTCDNEPANIRSSRIHVTDSGKLRIRSAKVGDSCNYRCEAADGFGTLSVIIKVVIVDKRLMEQLARQRNQTVTTNGRQQLNNNNNNNSLAKPKSIGKSANTSSSRDHSSGLVDDEPARQGDDTNEQHAASGANDKLARAGQVADLEVQVEPANVHVGKNKTFNLECRIKYSPNLLAPQIIWLKEFIGPKPSSLADALEHNLIVLDDVYYHSLNWPRSINYSHKSAGANSALLVRQSSFVHSGRYVCFAGYPPSLMAANLNSIASSSVTQLPSTTLATSHLVASSHRPMSSFRSLKYKMAQAIVKVDDEEGESNHKLLLESSQRYHGPSSILNIIASNSWIICLTIVLLLVCSVVLVMKFIQFRQNLQKTNNNMNCNQRNPARATTIGLTCDRQQPSNNVPRQISSSTSIFLDNHDGHAEPFDGLSNHNQNYSIQTSTIMQIMNNDNSRSPQTRLLKVDESGSNNNINDAIVHQTNADDNDHVYSEISDRDSDIVTRGNEPYYKKPNRNK